jgi:ABC-2 type transport system permease protein
MRKILVIAGREYRAAVKTKAFLITLVIMPVIMGGSILVQWLTEGQVDIREKRFAVLDRTPGEQLYGVIEKAARERNEKQIVDQQTGKQLKPAFAIEHVAPSAETHEAMNVQRFELSERVRKQELFGFLEIGPEAIAYHASKPAGSETTPEPRAAPRKQFASRQDRPAQATPDSTPERAAVRYQSASPTFSGFTDWVHDLLNQIIRERRFVTVDPRLNRDELQALLQPVPLLSKGLSERNAETGEIADAPDENKVITFVVPAVLIFMMFMMIMIGTPPLMQGVVEEKMQRIAEVLLGSVRPFELMMGKLIGMVGVSTTLAAVYLGGAYWAAYRYGFAHFIPLELLIWFVAYQTLAVLMVGSLFIAVGAACTDMRETQAMMWPVMILVMVPLFVWFNVIQEPNSTFSKWISFFPFATPMLMLGRQAIPPGIPWWQPALGIALVLLTTLLCVYVAGRIFRVGILLQGKGAKVSDLMKWVFRG